MDRRGSKSWDRNLRRESSKFYLNYKYLIEDYINNNSRALCVCS